MDKFNTFKPVDNVVWPINPPIPSIYTLTNSYTTLPRPLTAKKKEEKEEAFRKECKDNVQKMLKAFTFDEHMQIAFTPHIIIDTIWYFVDKVQAYCRDHRISEVKKLSRAINELRERYRQELRKDLSQKHLDQIHEK